jgi:4-hydroxymandelate oxidase
MPLINFHDHARAAQAALSPSAWAYFSGGAADELTLRRNDAAWEQWGLRPRVLKDLRAGHTRCQMLGKPWPMPLLVAPMAYQCWAHPHGESGMALAAAAQNCGFVLSHQTSTPLQDVAALIAAETMRGPLWLQLYWQAERDALSGLIQAAESAGYEALVLTIDAPVQGMRDRERRHDITLPAGVRAVHVSPVPYDTAAGLCSGVLHRAPTWSDVQWLRQQTQLPILLKGITHPEDARQALDAGVAGIVVSNHGGRVLDTVPATAELLPEIAKLVRNDYPQATLLVDGGIRRGTDLFKALAMGAHAGLIGRPAIYGLAHGGARGVAQVLRQLRDEFEMTLALCGCPTPDAVHSRYLQKLSPLP